MWPTSMDHIYLIDSRLEELDMKLTCKTSCVRGRAASRSAAASTWSASRDRTSKCGCRYACHRRLAPAKYPVAALPSPPGRSPTAGRSSAGWRRPERWQAPRPSAGALLGRRCTCNWNNTHPTHHYAIHVDHRRQERQYQTSGDGGTGV